MARRILTDQLHMLATVPRKGEVVVTLQHWGRPGSDATAVYVVCHNGEQATRKFAHLPTDVTRLREHFAAVRAKHAADLLSEDTATDQVVRRGGPTPRWCLKQDCPAGIPIPFAAEQCAAGCDAEGRGRIEFVSVTRQLSGGRR